MMIIINYALICTLILLTICIMFMWEGKMVWWLRLPGINLVVFVVLLILGTIEEVYLTFHPDKRNKWIKTSIFQLFF